MFFDIATQVTLPIVVVAGLGFALQRKLALDAGSLNRLQIYVLLPCFLVLKLSARFPAHEAGVTIWFTLLQFIVLVAVGWSAGALLRMPHDQRAALALSASFANSGNYNIPLVQLAFGDTYIPHQAVIVGLHAVLFASLGGIVLAQDARGWTGTARAMLRTPLIPAVAIGLLLRAADLQLPAAMALPLQLLGSAYAPVALFSLGVQLASVRIAVPPAPVAAAVVLRVLAAPLLTWLAVMALGLPRGLGDMLVVTAGAPVAVFLSVICAEYRTGADVAPATVFISTILSPVTITALLFAVRAF